MKRCALVVLFAAVAAAACGPGKNNRDVTAVVTGPATVAVGATVLLTVRLDYSDGDSLTLGPSHAGTVIWTSSNNQVAIVDLFGVVTGVGPGTVTITATPASTTSGTGKRTPGSHSLTVQ